MMDTADLPHLTPAELEVMKALWDNGRSSAREVHERVGEAQGWAYSTTRTTIDRLVRKGVLERSTFHGLNLFDAAISRAAGLARLVRDFASNVLESSPAPVLSLFADIGALSEDEIQELRELLLKADQGTTS